MCNVDQFDGLIDLTFQIVDRNNELVSAPRYRNIVEGSASDLFLLLEETGLLVPYANAFDCDLLERSINAWLAQPELVTRGVAFSARDVLKKLKRLGFREKSTEGSHVHLVSEERKGKVTVPVHGGEIRKGTLKSILNQAGIDLATFSMA